MRNNPKHGAKLENAELFVKLVKIERIRRFFTFKRQKIFKHFTLQPYHANFMKKNLVDYIRALDLFLMMDKKLVTHFRPDKIADWAELEPKDQIGFDVFYEELSNWAIKQKKLQYEDFAAAEVTMTENIADFKKTTDRML